MKILKKRLFWIIVLIIVLVLVFFPKSCGGGFGTGGPTKCDCIGFDTQEENKDFFDSYKTHCFGICLKNTCKSTVGSNPLFNN